MALLTKVATQRDIVSKRLLEASETLSAAASSEYPQLVEQAAEAICQAFHSGNKMLVFGNGGSASDAQHLAAELVVRFQHDRQALPVIALSSDPAVLTACANDYSYRDVFARQVEAFGRAGDVAFGISTSGASENVICALRAAKARGLTTIILTGPIARGACVFADIVLAAPGSNTARVQEVHLASYHALCELVERQFRMDE